VGQFSHLNCFEYFVSMQQRQSDRSPHSQRGVTDWDGSNRGKNGIHDLIVIYNTLIIINGCDQLLG
jgi:hypothetical protein